MVHVWSINSGERFQGHHGPLVVFYSCDFTGTQEELDEHLKVCKFEGMKEFLHRTDEKIADLQFSLNTKDQEIGFLRSMLGKLSEKVDNLEKFTEVKLRKLPILLLTHYQTAKILSWSKLKEIADDILKRI